jgi:phage baseplate assembly protein W
VAHTGADVYRDILWRIFSRAGLLLSSSGVSSRATTVTPKFTVHPATSGYDAARQLLSFLADRVVMRQYGGTLTEPLASAASTYTYGVTHPIRELRLLGAPPAVTDAQAYGAGAFGEAIDYASMSVGLGAKEQSRDLNSATGATAAATAVAQLRRHVLDTPSGALVVPPNVGQELLDLVDFSDPLVVAISVKRRVAGIDWRYDRRRGVYEQTLHLGAA